MWVGRIAYTTKIGDAERVEKDCYESEKLSEVTEGIHKAVVFNQGMDILEIHINKKQ